ncbi:MAG: 30S ribosomal protein S5, partial [Patescibacteria group bacterium]
MSDEIITTENAGAPVAVPEARGPQQGGYQGRPGGRRPGGRGDSRPRREKPKSEYDQKLIDVRRVARVVAGGRRFSFAVALVAGDRKGKVGVGTGKAGDTA